MTYNFEYEMLIAMGLTTRAERFNAEKTIFVPVEILSDVDGVRMTDFVNNLTAQLANNPLVAIENYLRGREVKPLETPKKLPERRYANKTDLESKLPWRNPQLVTGRLAEAYKFFEIETSATYNDIVTGYLKKLQQVQIVITLRNEWGTEFERPKLEEVQSNYRIIMSF